MRLNREERHRLILDLLADGREYHIEELAVKTGSSLATLRRDLEYLDQSKLLVRTHGGARPLEKSGFRPSYADRMNRQGAEKRAIAREALSLIQRHDTIALCNGTTTYYLAEEICASGLEVTVITNAIDAALLMAGCSRVRSILVGGEVTEGYTLSGVWGEPLLQRASRIDKAFLGADGATLTHGLTAYYPNDAAMHSQMASLAQEVIALVDHTKFGVVKLSSILPLSGVHLMITDDGLAPEVQDSFRAEGVNLTIAPTGGANPASRG